jgi:hypothetical protein
MSKVVQLRAAIAPRGFALRQHLNLMSSDARNRARWHDIGPRRHSSKSTSASGTSTHEHGISAGLGKPAPLATPH